MNADVCLKVTVIVNSKYNHLLPHSHYRCQT